MGGDLMGNPVYRNDGSGYKRVKRLRHNTAHSYDFNPFGDALVILPFDSDLSNRQANEYTASLTATSTDPAAFVTGKDGNALDLSKATGVSLSSNISSKLTGNFSVAFWVKINSNGLSPYPYYRRACWYQNSIGYIAIPEIAYNTTPATLNTMAIGRDSAYVKGTVALNDGNWHMVVVTKFSTAAVCYIDNAATEIIASNNAIFANTNIVYPIILGHPTYKLNGYIDHFCFWDYIISSQQMDYMWNNGTGRFE